MEGAGKAYEKTYGRFGPWREANLLQLVWRADLMAENTVVREPRKARYDVKTIREIIEQAHFVNVAFVGLDGLPQCIPMVCAIEETPSGDLFAYIHGYSRARLVKLLPPETRVCLTATLLDGIGLSLSAFNSTLNHRSAVLHGQVVDWDDEPGPAEAQWEAARRIVDAVFPGRWEACRQPTKAEMTTTAFLKIKVLTASAKCRRGEANEEKRDERDGDLTSRVWAGVIPTQIAYGTPIPSSKNKMDVVPDYINAFIKGEHAPSG